MRILSTLAAVVLVVSTASAQHDYAEIEVTNGGRIEGQVVFEGVVPGPLQLLITKDMEVCGEGYRERHEIVTTEEGGLLNVVVFIEEIAAGKPWAATSTGGFINQEECFFTPHIQVLRRGREVDIINSDSTLHNIHGYELIGRARRSMFNISQPEMGPVPQMFDPQRGNRVSLECDSHDFMQGWVFMADHPYATVVDPAGGFVLGDVPPGTYRLSAWHPRLGMQAMDITVDPDASSVVEISYAQ